MRRLSFLLALGGLLDASPLTYENLPLGETDQPLILRTYVPDPGLPDGVFAHHDQATASPKYTVGSGRDIEGEYQPVQGIPAAIAVNHGPALSYAFDTTECRLMYAWQGGFLDMFPYWGEPDRGTRQSFGYVPSLVGTVFHLASGKHPLEIAGKSLSELGAPDFEGYDLDPQGVPTFRYRFGEHRITQRVEPLADAPFSCRITYRSEPANKLGYRGRPDAILDRGALVVTLRGKALSKHSGFPRRIRIGKPDARVGQQLFESYGCIACHTTDGSDGHGPSLAGLFGKQRPLEGGGSVKADDAYLRESILQPNAKTAEGFPPNYMPPYPLKDKELESLILFIRSLADR